MRIYLDNAATTHLCNEAKIEMIRVMNDVNGNPSSIHAEGRMARTVIENARKIIAKVLNASVGEIFFTSGSTEATNMILNGAVNNLQVKRIITSPIEHHCVLHTLEKIKNNDVEIIYLPINKSGEVSLNELEKLLFESNVKTMVTLMHANNEIGTMHNLQNISEICHRYNAIFHSDTTQTIGHVQMDVQLTKLHFLTGSAHKFYGQKGVGFVYINADVHIEPLILGGSQERNMRAGTENIIGIAGMAAALEFSLGHIEQFQKKIEALRDYLKEGILKNISGTYINGADSNFLPKVLSVSFPNSPKNEMLLMNLDINGISASGGSACSSGVETQSGVLDHINEPAERKTVRFSFSHHNTFDELDHVVATLKRLF